MTQGTYGGLSTQLCNHNSCDTIVRAKVHAAFSFTGRVDSNLEGPRYELWGLTLIKHTTILLFDVRMKDSHEISDNNY
jgi:hypothetical protein